MFELPGRFHERCTPPKIANHTHPSGNRRIIASIAGRSRVWKAGRMPPVMAKNSLGVSRQKVSEESRSR